MLQIPNPALLSDLAAALLLEETTARQAATTGQAPGPITGLAGLDEDLGGYLAPGLHTLLAAPGAGKTALALQIAAFCGCPALYVSSEMRRTELLRRIIARTTRTYLGKLRGGTLSDEELRARLVVAAKACPMLALYDATEQRTSRADIQERAAALRERFAARHVLVVIDSVTDWAASAVSGDAAASLGLSEYALAEGAINALTQIAADLSCVVVAIAHRSRAGQKAQGADKLHAAKATGRYEYVSESVWDLERDAAKEPDEQGRTPAQLTLLKNRHGATGITLSLHFEGRLQTFTEM